MTGPSDLILSILMLAGGVVQIGRKEKRGWLMLVAALVVAGNVLIWSI